MLKIKMDLVTDPDDPYQVQYPGSAVWVRKTSYWGGLFSTQYPSVQVIDGLGLPIEPAWSEFQQSVLTTIVPGLRENRLEDRLAC